MGKANFKHLEEDYDMKKNWREVGILTLDHVINDKDEFLTYSVLKDEYNLSDIAKWQYLQLQHFLTT